MAYDPEKHDRRSIRLEGYDYRRPGGYFVTICVQDKARLLGEVTDGEMRLNPAGRMIRRWWQKMPDKFSNARLDASVVMPNHFHGIIVITDDAASDDAIPNDAVGADPCVRPNAPRVCPPTDPHVRPDGGTPADVVVGAGEGAHVGAPLPAMVQWFKTMTTNAYIRGVKQRGWQPFPGRLWQRNFWERVVRNDDELDRVRRYIAENPLRWHHDRYHP